MRHIATADFETDPFEFGREPQPFACGFYDGYSYWSDWSSECAARFVERIKTLPDEYYIYFHNGGRFDFFFLLPFLEDGSIRIINNRIVEAKIGHHLLRDSFAIMPFPLAKYKKDEISYTKLESKVREKNKPEIMAYLQNDCKYLHELVSRFFATFGDKLTVGQAAYGELKKFYHTDHVGENFDHTFRSKFYYGGRNQVFRSGIIRGDYHVFDVNSMYPAVMRNFEHPVGCTYDIDKRIRKDTFFVVATGRNHDAFPTRMKDGGLDFTVERGTFKVTIHEWNAGVETGRFLPDKILKTYTFKKHTNYADFVDHFYNLRIEAGHVKDEALKLFYKYTLNSAYGKFAQNPDNYCDYCVCTGATRPKDWHDCNGACDSPCKRVWTNSFISDHYVIWSRPSSGNGKGFSSFNNVATGASITGAARSILLRGLHEADSPLYCDTDSIIAKNVGRSVINPELLGAWKLEASCAVAAISGKKLYALFSEASNPREETCVKKAHKGSHLTATQILKITQGKVIDTFRDSPTYSWNGKVSFVQRRIRRTANQ